MKNEIKEFLKQSKANREDILIFAKELKSKCNNVFFKLATGVGKTKIGLETSNGKTLILCERIPHVTSWLKEIDKHNVDGEFTVICYKSVHKYLDIDWDTIIIDEVDACLGDNALTYYTQLKTKSWTFLSADAEKEHIVKIKSLCEFVTLEINLKLSIKWDILPKPKFIFKGLMFDNVKRTIKLKNLKGLFNFEPKGMLYTQLELNNVIEKELTYWKKEANEKGWYKRIPKVDNEGNQIYGSLNQPLFENTKIPSRESINVNMIGSYRKLFYDVIKFKHFIDNIKPNLEDKRYIVFTGNIDLVSKLDNSVHSKLSKKKNHTTIEDFNNGIINNLSCVDVLTRGINLVECEVGVITSMTYKSFIKLRQRIGRILRSENPLIHILYMEGKEEGLINKFKNEL